MDYEYKKYVLLAYLKDIRNRFNRSELYPFMSDLVFHYRNLVNVKANKELLYDNFPKTLSQKDFQRLKLTYQQLIHDSEMMSVIPRDSGIRSSSDGKNARRGERAIRVC